MHYIWVDFVALFAMAIGCATAADSKGFSDIVLLLCRLLVCSCCSTGR